MGRYFLGESRKKIHSTFNLGNLYSGDNYKKASLKLYGKEFLETHAALHEWEQFYKKNISHFIVDSNEEVEQILPSGISTEFKRIKSVQQVKRFAAKYGRLGVDKLKNTELRRLTNSTLPLNIGVSTIEPIEFWFDCSKKVRAILSLYEALRVALKENGELDLDYEEICVKDGVRPRPHSLIYTWTYEEDGEEITTTFIDKFTEIENFEPDEIIKQNLRIGRNMLIQEIKPFINGYLNFKEEITLNDSLPLGINIIEHQYTESLITAIFHELWVSLVAYRSEGRCKYCGKAFEIEVMGRPRKTCSDSCRVLLSKNKDN